MRTQQNVQRRTLLLAATATGTWLLAGCGSTTEASTDVTSSAAAGDDTYSVTHVYGTTKVPKGYQRVVSVGYTDDQTMLSLGVKPVGMVDQYPAGDGADLNTSWPWVKDRWAGTVPAVVLTNGSSLNFEEVAVLEPDLIVGVYSDITEDDYAKLTAIAPTVAWAADVKDPFSAPWQDNARQIGVALGRSDQLEGTIDDITQQIATAKSDNPGFASQRAVAISWYQNSIAPFSSKDVRGKLLADLGFQTVPAVDAAVGDDFYTTLSSEQADLVDVDKVFFIGDAADRASLEADPGFAALAVHREGRVVYLTDSQDPPVGAALSQSTVASLPYGVTQVVAAARA